MRFMLLMTYSGGRGCDIPMDQWAPEDITAHMDFQRGLGQELSANGELVDAQGLAGPDRARTVFSDGTSAPVVTDGVYPESKEALAGYWTIDVDSVERAIEIAAKASAAPGPNGVAIQQAIEVREVMSVPATDV
jgi:hypothetical protein